jgi:NAD(P)-dependent dehydrogenase (short-subunit alcohol dehydrogenase family)
MTNIALVTGASAGLGLSLTKGLLDKGWKVIGVSRSKVSLEHPAYTHFSLDLSSAPSVKTLLESNEFKNFLSATKIALFNNAGSLGQVNSTQEFCIEDFEATQCLNVTTPIALMSAVMKNAPKAAKHIVNISSGAAISAYPGWGTYCTTKAALRMASMVAAKDYEYQKGPGSLTIISYAPGVLDTKMQVEVRESDPKSFPLIQKFLDLKASGSLLNPALPAADLIKMLDDKSSEIYIEKRFSI